MGALLCVAAGLSAGTANAASLYGFYGVNVQQVFNGSPASWTPQLAAMSNGGLQLARIDARWADVEPGPPSGGSHSYDWSQYDAKSTFTNFENLPAEKAAGLTTHEVFYSSNDELLAKLNAGA